MQTRHRRSGPITMTALALLTALATASTKAQDRAELERSTIVGNRELPKVLYIVPWKQPLPGVPSGKPLQSVLDETLAPLDRAVFRRQIDYSAQLQSQLQRRAAAATPPALPAPSGESR